MSVFINWLLMVLGVFGVIELTGMISIWVNRPKAPPACIMVVPIKGKLENTEQLLRYVREVAQWSPESQRAVLVDLGLEDESRDICQQLCRSDNRLEFYTTEQFAERLRGI